MARLGKKVNFVQKLFTFPYLPDLRLWGELRCFQEVKQYCKVIQEITFLISQAPLVALHQRHLRNQKLNRGRLNQFSKILKNISFTYRPVEIDQTDNDNIVSKYDNKTKTYLTTFYLIFSTVLR